MGNSILAGTLTFILILQPLALAQEKPPSPPAQLSPAPVGFGVVVNLARSAGMGENSK